MFKADIKQNVINSKHQNKIISNVIDKSIEDEVKTMVSKLLIQQNISNDNISIFDKFYDANKIILPVLKYVGEIHNLLNLTQCNFISTMLYDVSVFILVSRISNSPILATAANIFRQMCRIWNTIEEKVYERELSNTSNTNIKTRFFHKFLQNIKCTDKEVDPKILKSCHANYDKQKDILMRMLGDIATIIISCEDTKLRNKYSIIYTNVTLLYNVIWCADLPISLEIFKFFNNLDQIS
jgi:hypothetical protein